MSRTSNANVVEFRLKLIRELRDRLEQHAKWLGCDMTAIIRDAVIQRLEYLDERRISAAENKKRLVPEHKDGKPQGLGPMREKKPSTVTPPSMPPQNPFALLQPAPFVVPEKVNKAFRGWAEYLEEADGLVDEEQRAKKIVEDIKQRVEEKNVRPCYEAFVEFYTNRKEVLNSKTPNVILEGDTPIVGDV